MSLYKSVVVVYMQGAGQDAICIKEVRTNAAGRTTITRRCGRRDRCDPRMMGLDSEGVCSDDPQKGGIVCKTCNFGDPNDASVYGGFSVYRCHSTSKKIRVYFMLKYIA